MTSFLQKQKMKKRQKEKDPDRFISLQLLASKIGNPMADGVDIMEKFLEILTLMGLSEKDGLEVLEKLTAAAIRVAKEKEQKHG